jgi:glyoxylase-like metal-dependent hydrolase (beta-lactamase superfamily II)
MTRKRLGICAVALAVMAAACKGDEGDDKVATPATAEETAPGTGEKVPPASGDKSAAAGPEIHPFTASEEGFLVGSYAVVDSGEILLIDTQMIRPEVEKFIEMVKTLKGKVTTIYITHPHPDHYMGLDWLKAAFPDARVIATPATVKILKDSAEKTLTFMKSKDYFGGALKDVLPPKVIIPEEHAGDTIKVGASSLTILSFADSESKTAHPLFEPKTGSLFTGDLAYNKVHAWLKDTPPKNWITALGELKKLAVVKVYPGHGEPGGPEILDATLEYLKAWEAAVTASKAQKDLVTRVKEKYPAHRLPVIVEVAAPTYFKK